MKKTPFFKKPSKNICLKVLTLIISSLLLTITCYSQKPTNQERKIYKQAKKQLINENFKLSQDNYLKLIEINPKSEIYNFEGGLSYYFADMDRVKCIPLFEATIENSKEDTIPEIYYYLAKAYHFNGQYKEATDAFNKFKPFIKSHTNSGQKLMKQSEHYIKINENGNKYLANKNENIAIKNLTKGINSSYGEYAPVMKEDDDVFLFTSRRKTGNNKVDKDLLPYENVFVAKRINGVWQLLTDKKEIKKYIPKNLNSKKHEAGIIYSSDGQTLYAYKNNVIWKSIHENGKWSKLIELDENINSSQYNMPSVSLSKDGNTMFFVSYRKDGVGQKDIYKSVKNSKGNWSKAENLGETINTKLDEDSPHLSKDGKTLYFSSKGHNGIGGYDIFKSQLLNGTWGEAENMGIPINSSLDDIYLVMDNEEMNGFFASSRDGGLGGMDIYQVCMNCPPNITNIINGLLVDNSDALIKNGSIQIKNISSGPSIKDFQITDGEFTITTENVGKHELVIEAQDFEKQTTHIELPNTSSESNIKVKLSQFQKEDETFQIINITSSELDLNKSDTIKLEKLIAINTDLNNSGDTSDTNKNNSYSSNNIPGTTIGTYQKFYPYNSKKINANAPHLSDLITKAINKAKNGDKIYINIESSASKVPTKKYQSNTHLASLRANEAKRIVLNTMIDRGVNKKNIIVNSVNSIVSGPKYDGDFSNVEKYNKYQYIKITIK